MRTRRATDSTPLYTCSGFAGAASHKCIDTSIFNISSWLTVHIEFPNFIQQPSTSYAGSGITKPSQLHFRNLTAACNKPQAARINPAPQRESMLRAPPPAQPPALLELPLARQNESGCAVQTTTKFVRKSFCQQTPMFRHDAMLDAGTGCMIPPNLNCTTVFKQL